MNENLPLRHKTVCKTGNSTVIIVKIGEYSITIQKSI